jgi:GT2 family glycosyltransferase
MEIILVDGMSRDRTREIIKTFQNTYHFIRLIDNYKKIAPVAMNLGIKASSGEYIFILSAHATYDKNYFTKLIENIQRLNVDCVGGVLQTEVKNKNLKSNAIKEILMHPFGVGNATFRTGGKVEQEVDTVAFGCYTKETFKKYGLFDERLIRNQDIELNKRIINGGGRIYLVPDVTATYYARENFTQLAKNNFANGKWNILTAFYAKTLNSLSLRHFVPLIFILSLLFPLLLSFIDIKFLWITLLSLSSYLALVIMISLKSINDKNSFFYLIMSFLTLHISYGMGSLMGIFSLFKMVIKGIK